MRILIPLLLAAVAATGCAAQATSSGSAPASTTATGGSVDACKYFTQADAESMLGVPTGPGQPQLVSEDNGTCAYVPSGAATLGTRVALTLAADGATLTEFKTEWPDAVDVSGLAFPAMRNANGSNFAMVGNGRGCLLIISIKKPADPDAFARQVGAICAKALAS